MNKMFRVKILPYLGLFLVAVGLAYWASLPRNKFDISEATLYDIPRADFRRLMLQGASIKLEVTSGQNDTLWFRREGVPSEAQPAKSASEGKPEIQELFFKGNDKSKEILSTFLNLKVVRSIGKVDQERLKEFGFDEASVNRLKIFYTGGEIELWAGRTAYGSRNRYIRMVTPQSEGNEVFLMAGDQVNDLERSDIRLFERRVLALNIQDFDQFGIMTSSSTQEKQFKSGDSRPDSGMSWVTVDSGEVSTPAGAFMESLLKLRLDRYEQLDFQLPQSDGAESLRVVFYKNGRPIEEFTLLASKDQQGKAYARSGFSESWVEIIPDRAAGILSDINSILKR